MEFQWYWHQLLHFWYRDIPRYRSKKNMLSGTPIMFNMFKRNKLAFSGFKVVPPKVMEYIFSCETMQIIFPYSHFAFINITFNPDLIYSQDVF